MKFNKGMEEIRNIKMTAEEKTRMLENVLGSSVQVKRPIKSPYVIFSFISRLQKNHFAFYGVLACLVILVGGGGVVSASVRSLPGNILYSLKVKVVEPFVATFKSSPQDQAAYESDLAIERLVEAETLTDQGKLDKPKHDQLNTLLGQHTKALNKAIVKIHEENKNQPSKEEDDIVNNFDAKVKEHTRVVDEASTSLKSGLKLKENNGSEKNETNGKGKDAHQN